MIIKEKKTIHINHLPDVAFIKIFNNLSYKNLISISYVSKKWNQLSKSVWLSKIELKLFDLENLFSLFEEKEWVKLGLKRILLDKLNLKGLRSINLNCIDSKRRDKIDMKKLLNFLAKNCPNIEHFETSMMHNQLDNTAKSLVDFFNCQANLISIDLSRFLVQKSIIEAIFLNCHSLRVLKIDISLCDEGCLRVLSENSSITDLDLTYREVSDFNGTILIDIIKKCPNLERLKVDNLTPQELDICVVLAEHCPKINELNADCIQSNLHRLSSLRNLRKLSLSFIGIDSEHLAQLLNESKSLTHLVLIGYGLFFDSEAFTLLPIEAPLEYLEISIENFDIKREMLLKLSSSLKNSLKHLKILDFGNEKFQDSKTICDLISDCSLLNRIYLEYIDLSAEVLDFAHGLDRPIFMKIYMKSSEELGKFLADKMDKIYDYSVNYKDRDNHCVFRFKIDKLEAEIHAWKLVSSSEIINDDEFENQDIL